MTINECRLGMRVVVEATGEVVTITRILFAAGLVHVRRTAAGYVADGFMVEPWELRPYDG